MTDVHLCTVQVVNRGQQYRAGTYNLLPVLWNGCEADSAAKVLSMLAMSIGKIEEQSLTVQCCREMYP